MNDWYKIYSNNYYNDVIHCIIIKITQYIITMMKFIVLLYTYTDIT